MKNETFIEDVYGELKQLELVESSVDFSENWLGMEGGYFRCLKAKGRQPSAKVLAKCAVNLQRMADIYGSSKMTQVGAKGAVMRSLADSCWDQIVAIGRERR